MDKNFTVKRIKSALLAIKSKISDPQMAMLRAHYLYRIASMEKIANFGGYGNYRAGNLQYGSLCGRIAAQLGFVTPNDHTYTIATVREPDAKGHFQWHMDDVVAKALEDLGWVSQRNHQDSEKVDFPDNFGEVTETERKALINARIGQGQFRMDLIALWGTCAVTGCSLERVLVASHIVPWALASNVERLDPFNGLLLTPNLDKLVDCLFISFNDDGSILLSKDLRPEIRGNLGISEKSKLRFVRPAMRGYLKRHRKLFFGKTKRD